MFWYISGSIAALIIAFIWWRYTSVARGARQRDEKILSLLDPIGEELAAGETPTPNEIEPLAKNPATRSFLYELLEHFERLELFPDEYRSEISQAEAKLVYWMMHPNELQDAPDETELAETLVRNIEGQDCRFHVFRYRMPNGHWAGDDWLLGLAGPFIDNDPPYAGVAGAFSRAVTKMAKSSHPNSLIGLLEWSSTKVVPNNALHRSGGRRGFLQFQVVRRRPVTLNVSASIIDYH